MFNFTMENDFYCTAVADAEFTSTIYVRLDSIAVNTGNVRVDKILLDRFGSQSKLVNKVNSFDVINKSIPMLRIEGKAQSKIVSCIDRSNVLIINLSTGDSIMVDNRNLLAFNSSCEYSMKSIAEGFVGANGLLVCKLTATKDDAQVALILDGTHYVIGDPAKIDAGNLIGWLGDDPKFVSNIGDSYAFEFNGSGNAIIQPIRRHVEFGGSMVSNSSRSAISNIESMNIDEIINKM